MVGGHVNVKDWNNTVQLSMEEKTWRNTKLAIQRTIEIVCVYLISML